jgi:hypothetical protein
MHLTVYGCCLLLDKMAESREKTPKQVPTHMQESLTVAFHTKHKQQEFSPIGR